MNQDLMGHFIESNDTRIRKWLIAGFIWMITVGPVWHFLYDWSGRSNVIGLISPVNESVWEHLKMGYWALLIFSPVEYFFLKGKVNNYFPARVFGILLMSGTILATFYSYSAFTGHSILWVDITSYFAGAAVCQLIATYLFQHSALPSHLRIASLLIWIFLAIGFAWLTVYPPEWPIFMDHRFGTFGMPQ